MNGPHRKRRIASDEAHAWARNLRLKNSLAKLVLCMVTGYVDGEGACFVGVEALGEDTELSADTVRKRLHWLEQVGAIARFPQWIDANGRRNGEGKGRRTSDEIRLMLHADPELIEARANGEQVDETATEHTDDDEASPRSVPPVPQQGLNEPDPPAGPALTPPLAPERPSDSGKGLSTNLNPEPEHESPTPTVPQPSGGEGGEDLELWNDFKREFEADGDVIIKPSVPMTLFAALNVEQRKLLIRAARGLIAVRKQQKSVRPKPAPATFIRETDSWENFATHAPPRVQDFHYIPTEGREADAYRNLHQAGRAPMPADYGNRYTLKRALTAAELAFANMPHHRKWRFVSEKNQIASWIEFFSHALLTGARRALVESHIVEGGAERGFYSPWPWPPTKDGKIIPWPPIEETKDSPSESAA